MVRKASVPTRTKFTEEHRRLVREMAAVGIPQRLIAKVIIPGGVSEDTIQRHFGDEMERAKVERNVEAAGYLYENVRNGNVAAQIFWMKTQAGWREVAREDDAQRPQVSFQINFVTPTAVTDDRPQESLLPGENVAVFVPRSV